MQDFDFKEGKLSFAEVTSFKKFINKINLYHQTDEAKDYILKF